MVDMQQRSFLVLHGWENHRPADHWQHWLAGRLVADGAQVLYPQLPEPDQPVLDEWLLDLRRYAEAMRGEERILICHSLAVLLWWTAAVSGGAPEADRVLLVAPPAPAFLRDKPVADFVPAGMDAGLDTGLLRTVRLVAGDDDPYCPGGAVTEYADRYGVDIDIVDGGGHLNAASGYGPWPSMLDWCRDRATRIKDNDGP